MRPCVSLGCGDGISRVVKNADADICHSCLIYLLALSRQCTLQSETEGIPARASSVSFRMSTVSAIRGLFLTQPRVRPTRGQGKHGRSTKSCRHAPYVTSCLLRSSPELPGDVRWRQMAGSLDVRIEIPLPPDTPRGDITVRILPDTLAVAIVGLESDALVGTLPSPVDVDGCFWEKEGDAVVVFIEKRSATPKWEFLLESDLPKPGDTTVTTRVFMDITINGEPTGRITFGLFGKQVPKTCENFRALCAGNFGVSKSGTALHFKGTCFHRIVPGHAVEGGDITTQNGTGGESIYGTVFDDEGCGIAHDQPYLLSMASGGKNANGSRFVVTAALAPERDNKNVVFGRVIDGVEVVTAMEQKGTAEGKPRAQVAIAECGELSSA